MIKIVDVTKTYNTGKVKFQALKGVSLDIEKGEFVAIIGPSGSGKSTLMNIIGCLDLPTTGKYYFEDKEINNYRENQLADIRNKKIGFIFQKFNLLSNLNTLENVELPLIYRGMDEKQRKEKALKLLQNVGLSNHLNHTPSELSGGQQQRVAIARALAGEPQIILADEPTGNLDTKSGKEVLSILKELNRKGTTIILITHDMEVAESAKRIVTIRDGLILEERVV
ncbi:MAG: putative transport system ATP-binding protein [Candidatus Petromonas sp.]|jgi:putative ABC transport system ATP-binding protein|nr:putative transport system ATP-binding protein [Candidatus Petromonas sp.]